MMLLKGCPRCRGDLHTDRDLYGEYVQCIQCGYMQDIDPRTTRSAVPKSTRRAA